MSMPVLSLPAVRAALALRDLSDPSSGPHAMQILLDEGLAALQARWGLRPRVHRASPLVSVADNYDLLGYPEDSVAREARYTRYVGEGVLLRTQTSAAIPPLLRELSRQPARDVVLACPGLVYRRDCIDRLHTGEPHQVDVWRLRPGEPLRRDDLLAMVTTVLGAMLPGRTLRVEEASHPYSEPGIQVDVEDGERWVEVGEGGLTSPALLRRCGLAVPGVTGMGLGLGLDRILMLRKGLDDIRLLRSTSRLVQAQMIDLAPWREVSSTPPVRRDLSLACEPDVSIEDLGDRVRSALGDDAAMVEDVEIIEEMPGELLPVAARERLGMLPGQKNVLLRVTLRDLDRALTDAECNQLRDRIHAALHQGAVHTRATPRR